MTFLTDHASPSGATTTARLASRAAWVTAQRAITGLGNGTGPLLALVGDCVADPDEGVSGAAEGHRAVGQLIAEGRPDAFIPLGDNVYLQGLEAVYDTEYNASYGRLLGRTYPVPGNHEMQGCLHPTETNRTVTTTVTDGATSVTLDLALTEAAVGDSITFAPSNPVTSVGSITKTITSIAGTTYGFSSLTGTITSGQAAYTQNEGQGYANYFGARAPQPVPYYFWSARNIGRYRMYFLDSNSSARIASGSTQMEWLIADIAAHPGVPLLAAWHHPRWTDSTNVTVNDDNAYEYVWSILQGTGRCQAIFNGHDHNYQRWDRCIPQGSGVDPLTAQSTGTTQFVVGTGGYNNFDCPTAVRASYVNDAYDGALFVRLGPTSWAHAYVNTAGTVLDTGTHALIGV